jgi:methyl-accepting chemotaxis protein
LQSTDPSLPVASALQRRLFRCVLIASLPSAAVGVFAFSAVLDLGPAEIQTAIAWLVPVFLWGCLQQAFTIRHLVRATLADRPGEAPGERLGRILVLPRKVELFSHLPTWLFSATLYGAIVHLALGRGAGLMGLSFLLAVFVAAFPGVLLVLFAQDAVLPLALEERARLGHAAPRGSGFLWTRQRFSLPYAFGVGLVSLLGVMALLLNARYLRALAGLEARLADAGLAAVAPTLRAYLQDEVGGAATAVALVAAVFVLAFCATGFLLARRQARAVAAVEEALGTVVAGTPTPPRWVATDEIGDLATGATRIALEMKGAFDQLRAMAAGDLGRELEGDSGLLEAFRVSRGAMLELTRRMNALARGEATAEGRITGDLGAAFAGLQASLQAIADQAGTIAAGDLRRDVALPGALGELLQRMTGNLRDVVGRTQEVSATVGDLVVTLQAASAQLSAATSQQVAAVTETSSTMAEMAQTSAVSADRAAELIRQGEAASAVSEEGGASAEAAVSAMGAIGASLDQIAEASRSLSERARKIDGIVDTVSFLADQSSTLAINAAIEAARAGEAGKGFAVVAREVRTLAADSRGAAGQIRQILGEIREGTGRVDGAVGTGSRTIAEGAQLVQRLGDVVAQLGVTVHDAVGLMRQVEGSARQHQAGTGQVSQALASMQSASESIRDGAASLADLSAKARDLSEILKASAAAYTLPGR